MDYKIICKQVVKIVEQAGEFVRDERRELAAKGVEVKGKHNFVTHVDKATEEKLVSQLKVIVPEAGFIGEEGDYGQKSDEYNWIIDPIDGTTNFIHGTPPYAISVGLVLKNEPVVGVILEIHHKELFYGSKNGGAWLNGQPIKVSTAQTVNDSLLATGFPYTQFDKLEGYLDTFSYFTQNSHGLRRLGSAAMDMAYVACGRYDGFYEYGLHPWDIAAGACILAEAGGMSTDFGGRDGYLFNAELVASNGIIHEEFLNAVAQRIYKKHV